MPKIPQYHRKYFHKYTALAVGSRAYLSRDLGRCTASAVGRQRYLDTSVSTFTSVPSRLLDPEHALSPWQRSRLVYCLSCWTPKIPQYLHKNVHECTALAVGSRAYLEPLAETSASILPQLLDAEDTSIPPQILSQMYRFGCWIPSLS
jgi:hypothetical protein